MDIRNTITRFGATALIGCGLVVTAIPATFAHNGEETVTHEYQDRAASHISEVWYKGETLKISGEGFLTQDRASGSTIAIKLNKGAVKIDGKDYLEVTANDKGEFTVSIPWQNDLEDRVSVDVYLLSGSLKDNDTSRGGKAATVKIEARSVAPESPSASASAEPSVSASASASASATAELKKDPARTSVRSLTLIIAASVARLLTTVPLRMEAPPRTVVLLRRMVLTRVHRVARIVWILLRRTPLFRAVRSVPRWLTPVLRTCLPGPVWAWSLWVWVLLA